MTDSPWGGRTPKEMLEEVLGDGQVSPRQVEAFVREGVKKGQISAEQASREYGVVFEMPADGTETVEELQARLDPANVLAGRQSSQVPPTPPMSATEAQGTPTPPPPRPPLSGPQGPAQHPYSLEELRAGIPEAVEELFSDVVAMLTGDEVTRGDHYPLFGHEWDLAVAEHAVQAARWLTGWTLLALRQGDWLESGVSEVVKGVPGQFSEDAPLPESLAGSMPDWQEPEQTPAQEEQAAVYDESPVPPMMTDDEMVEQTFVVEGNRVVCQVANGALGNFGLRPDGMCVLLSDPERTCGSWIYEEEEPEDQAVTLPPGPEPVPEKGPPPSPVPATTRLQASEVGDKLPEPDYRGEPDTEEPF